MKIKSQIKAGYVAGVPCYNQPAKKDCRECCEDYWMARNNPKQASFCNHDCNANWAGK